jgi:hypothetical protein
MRLQGATAEARRSALQTLTGAVLSGPALPADTRRAISVALAHLVRDANVEDDVRREAELLQVLAGTADDTAFRDKLQSTTSRIVRSTRVSQRLLAVAGILLFGGLLAAMAALLLGTEKLLGWLGLPQLGWDIWPAAVFMALV